MDQKKIKKKKKGLKNGRKEMLEKKKKKLVPSGNETRNNEFQCRVIHGAG